VKSSVIYVKTNFTALVLLALGLIASFTIATFLIIEKEASRIYDIASAELAVTSEDIHVGIVFGGGVTDEQPLPLLKDRLHAAKQLLDNGLVDKLILSGDNRSLDYNEPAVMLDYLVNSLGVDRDKLQRDYAGRSTYETCERAQKIFGLTSAILVSESTHLPRAIYLCRHFGIDAYGIKSDGQASSGLRIGQRWREVLARDKAVFNSYFFGERTILGDPISL
jgi:vancomycin permeability regulator SanA